MHVGCIKCVFGHKWWARLWIFQESLLSKNVLLMLSATILWYLVAFFMQQ